MRYVKCVRHLTQFAVNKFSTLNIFPIIKATANACGDLCNLYTAYVCLEVFSLKFFNPLFLPKSSREKEVEISVI